MNQRLGFDETQEGLVQRFNMSGLCRALGNKLHTGCAIIFLDEFDLIFGSLKNSKDISAIMKCTMMNKSPKRQLLLHPCTLAPLHPCTLALSVKSPIHEERGFPSTVSKHLSDMENVKETLGCPSECHAE
jgi:hypothetical protein